MIDKFLLIACILFLSPQLIRSQKHLEGTITNKDDGVGVANVSILLKDLSDDLIIAYTFSKENGQYSISYDNIDKNLVLQTSVIGYKDTVIPLSNLVFDKLTRILDIALEEEITQLLEVDVVGEAPPVVIKNDTTVYKVSSFQDGSEKVVEDILKKLPGIEVDEQGRIKYKDKEIEALLIEGDDLFSSDYSRGTKNINVDVIDKIEAIENFSKNRLLKGIEDSEKVALNLKIKEGKEDVSYNAKTNFGIKNRFDTGGNALLVSKRIKAFSFLEYNNIGRTSSELPYSNEINGNEVSRIDEIIPDYNFQTSLSESRSNINNSVTTAGNGIFNLSDKTTLRLGIIHYNDRFNRTLIDNTRFEFSDEVFDINSTNTIESKPVENKASFSIFHDISKSSRIEYSGELFFNHTTTRSDILNNESVQFDNLVTNIFLTNHNVRYTKSFSSESVLDVNTQFFFGESAKTYQIFPGFDFNDNSIDPTITSIQTVQPLKRSISTEVRFLGLSKKTKYNFGVGINYSNEDLSSELSDDDVNILATNNLDHDILNPYIDGNYKTIFGNWIFRSSLRLTYFDLTLQRSDQEISLDRLFLLPTASLSFKPNDKSRYYLNFDYEVTNQRISNLFANNILTRFREVNLNTPNLTPYKQKRIEFGYAYNDLFNNFRLNVRIGYNDIRDNFIRSQTIDRDLSVTNFLIADGLDKSYNFAINLTKYIHFIRSTIDFNNNLRISSFRNLVNGSELRNNDSNVYSGNLVIRNSFFNKTLFLANALDIQNTVFRSPDNIENRVGSIKYSFEGKLRIKKKWSFSVNYDYLDLNISEQGPNFNFLDTNIDYSFPKTNLNLGLGLQNIFNERRFETISNSDFSTSTFSFDILERYLLLKLSYRF